jgi:hypothetical protein
MTDTHDTETAIPTEDHRREDDRDQLSTRLAAAAEAAYILDAVRR